MNKTLLNSPEDQDLQAVIHRCKYNFIIPFMRATKSMASLALDAFVKLLTPAGNKASQCALFQMMLAEKKRRNFMNSHEERRFGSNSELFMLFLNSFMPLEIIYVRVVNPS